MLFSVLAAAVVASVAVAHNPTDVLSDPVPQRLRGTTFRDAYHLAVAAADAGRSGGAQLGPVAAQVGLRGASNASCEICTVVAVPLLAALNADPGNVTAALDAVCDLEFNGTERDVCRVAAAVLVDVGHTVVHSLAKYDWPIVTMLCSDLLTFCLWECCSQPAVPEQIRLSFASQQTVAPTSSMRVTWVTLRHTPGAAVQWRPANGSAWLSAPAEDRTYTKGGWVGVIHSAVIGPLRAGASYSYRVGAGASAGTGWSAASEFRTMPLNAGTPERPLRVLGIADMGYGANSDGTVRSMQRQVAAGNVDFILHYGDIGYADGAEAGWDLFFRKIGSITRVVPYMVSPGNHELFWNFTAYRTRMWTPPPGDGAPDDAMYYSFSAGPVSFVMVNSESVVNTPEINPTQHRWIERQLLRANAARQLIHVTHHRPLYCSTTSFDCKDFTALLRDAVEALYVEQRVALASFGHVHAYERSHPTINGKVVGRLPFTTAPVYCVNGAAGNREGQNHTWTEPRPAWSAIRSQDFGYAMVEYSRPVGSNVTTLKQRFLQSGTDLIVDNFTIVKNMS